MGRPNGCTGSKLSLLLAGAILLPGLSRAQDPDGVWSPLLPLSRADHSAIYDPVRDRMLIFGGRLGFGGTSREVWEFSLGGAGAWKRVTTNGESPPPLLLHSAIYDPVDDRMVVFGGVGGTHDVWALSLSDAPTWTHLSPGGTPPSDRYSALAVYDPVRHRMILFGGLHFAYNEPSTALNDVWALSLGPDPQWSEILPSGTRPTARYYHLKGGIYDPIHDRLIVFGGNTYSSIYLNDLWALNLSGAPTWTPLAAQGDPPAPRTFHSAVYDAAGSRMLVYGGLNGGGFLGDAWALSLDDPPVWSQLAPSGALPGPRAGHGAIYDPIRDRMVVFGPSFSGDVDAWSLSLSGAPAWSILEPVNFPPRRSDDVTVLDRTRERIITFGGRLALGAANDVWTFPLASLEGWSPLVTSGTPPPARSGSAGVYDPTRDRLLIFGGTTSAPDDAVWSLGLGPAPEWSVLPSTGAPPSPRSGHSLVYDSQRDRFLLFGGTGLNDLWSLSVATVPAVWKLLAPAGAPPPAGWTHTAFYDQARDRMLVFQYSGSSVKVWELSLSPLEWRALLPMGTAPTGRFAFSTVFDDQRNRILLYGGVRSSEGPNPVLEPFNDVWAFDLAGDGAWYRPAIAGEVAPGVWEHGAVYDHTGDRMVVCGGLTGYAFSEPTSVTWELRLQGTGPVPLPRLPALFVAARPNPSSRGLDVSFLLPSAEAARIDVLDATGRRVASREVGSLGPGSHFIRVGTGLRIPPGIYFLRLTQGAKTVSAKAAVIK